MKHIYTSEKRKEKKSIHGRDNDLRMQRRVPTKDRSLDKEAKARCLNHWAILSQPKIEMGESGMLEIRVLDGHVILGVVVSTSTSMSLTQAALGVMFVL